jgi:hypothetical protein
MVNQLLLLFIITVMVYHAIIVVIVQGGIVMTNLLIARWYETRLMPWLALGLLFRLNQYLVHKTHRVLLLYNFSILLLRVPI